MTSHRRKTVTLTSLSVRQWARIVAIFVGFVSVVTLGIASRNFYSASKNHSAKPYITAYSATDSAIRFRVVRIVIRLKVLKKALLLT